MNIDFIRRPTTGDPLTQQPVSPRRRSQSPVAQGGIGGDSVQRRPRSRSPDTNAGPSDGSLSRQLKEYAITCARHNRLSATAEEGLLEFAQVMLYDPHAALHTHVTLPSLTRKKSSFTSVRRWCASSNRLASLKPTRQHRNPIQRSRPSQSLSWWASSLTVDKYLLTSIVRMTFVTKRSSFYCQRLKKSIITMV